MEWLRLIETMIRKQKSTTARRQKASLGRWRILRRQLSYMRGRDIWCLPAIGNDHNGS